MYVNLLTIILISIQVVIDELYLLLRIYDVLINILVKAAVAEDSHVTRNETAHRDTLLLNDAPISCQIQYH